MSVKNGLLCVTAKCATCLQKEEEASRASGRKERLAQDGAGKDERPAQQRTSARESDNGDAGSRHSKRPRTEAEVGRLDPCCCPQNTRGRDRVLWL